MKKLFLIAFAMVFMGVLLTGCTEADMNGIVLEVNENGIKLAQDLSTEEYAEIKDVPVSVLQEEDVQGERDSLGLIDILYDDAEAFSEGDRVEVWIDGDIMDSYPAQADAKKISEE